MPEVRRVVTDYQHHLLRFSQPVLALKAARTGRVEGIASAFGPPPDRQGDIIRAGAFAKSLSEHARLGTAPGMHWNHQHETPIGRWTHLREDAEGLFVEGQINLNTSPGREAFKYVEAGDASGLSIGYKELAGGRKYLGAGSFEISAVDLVEISITPVPASPRARLTAVKSLTSRAELVDLLRDGGLARKAAELIAAGGWPALTGDDRDEAAARLAAALEKSLQRMRTS